MKTLLNESTLMPVSLVIIVIAVAAWMTKIEQNANATGIELKEFKGDTKASYERIDNKLEKMDEKIDRLFNHRRIPGYEPGFCTGQTRMERGVY
jgi:hypothetical protein